MIFLPLIFLVGGFAGRIRGNDNKFMFANYWFGKYMNDTFCRYIVWGCPVGALVGHNTYYDLSHIVLAGLGASIGYWGSYNFVDKALINSLNIIKLSVTGAFRFSPLLIAAIINDYICHTHYAISILPSVLAGLSFVPIYLFCSIFMQNVKCGPLLQGWTEYGEFFFWGTIYSALYLGFQL